MRRSVSLIRLSSSASAVSRSRALGLELLDVRHGLLVLLLGQRVDRAELLAPAREPLDPGAAAPRARSSGSGSLGAARLEAEPAGDLGQLALGLGGGVAHLLGGHLRAASRPRWPA